MSKAKSRYTGEDQTTAPKAFSSKLHAKLKGHYPNPQAADFSGNDLVADEFVCKVLGAAHWAISELDWHKLERTKEEMRAEQQGLLKPLRLVKDRLSNLSSDFRFLADDDLWRYADQIDDLIGYFEGASSLIDGLSTREKIADKQSRVAAGIAIDVLRILKGYGISAAATADADLGYISDAIHILKTIGDDIGLCRSEVTWRDIVMEVKKSTPDLQ